MRTIDIDRLPSLDNILTGDLISEFRKTIIDVVKCASGSEADNITRKLVFTLSMLEDAREEYYDTMEEGGEI